MAQVILAIETPLPDPEGRSYLPQVCGRKTERGPWEGWIEFLPADGGPTLRTPRETEQPDPGQLEYWALGLTRAYLEGALDRARRPPHAAPAPPTERRAVYEEPAPAVAATRTRAAARPHGVLDPFRVYGQGERTLKRELAALDEDHLRDIVREHGLTDEATVDLDALTREGLRDLIVGTVRRRVR